MNLKSTENPDLLLQNYHFDLPKELIADRPGHKRGGSRLLVYNHQNQEIIHTEFTHLRNYLPQSSSLVINETKVFPARILGKKASGGKAEIFFLDYKANENGHFPCMIKTTKQKKIAQEFILPNNFLGIIKDIGQVQDQAIFFLELLDSKQKILNAAAFLSSYGLIPLPPYIRNGLSDEADKIDYQTCFANQTGSVAAPTAGLHFTPDHLDQINAEIGDVLKVCLHVGMGTFAPVKTACIKDHQMHHEYYEINQKIEQQLKEKKGNLIPVGTTSFRTLGNYFSTQKLTGKTDLFVHPGVSDTQFKHNIAGLITNFHLPESSLLMLVSYLIGREKTLELYEKAIKEKYQFYSYGDAMLILL